MSSNYKVSSICENCVSDDVQESLACTPTHLSYTKSRVTNQRANKISVSKDGKKESRRTFRTTKRRFMAVERKKLYAARDEIVLSRYSSFSSYRSDLRSLRYDNGEEVWTSRARVQYEVIYEEFIPHSAYEDEFNAEIVDNPKEVNKSKIALNKAHKPMYKTVVNDVQFKNKKYKKKRKNLHKFVPHAGVDLNVIGQLRNCDMFGDLSIGLGDSDGLVFKRIEDFVLTITKVSLMNDYRLILLEIISYVKTFSDRSIVSSAIEYIISIFSSTHDKQVNNAVKTMLDENFSWGGLDASPREYFDDDFVPEGGVDNFVNAFRGMATNFSRVKENSIFKKISYILSACVTLGLCDASKVTWSLGGIRLFSPDAFRKHVDASSLISAILDTVVFFIEGGRELFLHGDIGGFLFSDKKVRDVNDDFNFLMSNWDHVVAGNFEKLVLLPETEYSYRLDKTIETLRMLRPSVEKEDLKHIRFMESSLLQIRAQYQTKKTTGGFKRAPFVVCIHGESGLGKSVVQERIMTDTLVALGFDPDPKNIAYYNPYDEYDSCLRGNTIGIFMDEVANTKPEFEEKPSYQLLMRVNNNAKATAVMADLELKNKITIEPEVVVMTTNDATIGAHDFSKNPVSVLRRVHVYLDFRVRPEFKRDGADMIDPDKVYAEYGNKEVWEVQDVWLCDMYEYVGTPNSVRGRADSPNKRYLSDKDGVLKNVGYARMIRYIIDSARKNYAQQMKLVEDNGKYYKSVKLCSGCNYLQSICQCKDPEIVIKSMQNKSSLMEPHSGKDTKWFKNPLIRRNDGFLASTFKHLLSFWIKTKTNNVVSFFSECNNIFMQYFSPFSYEHLLEERHVLQVEIIRWKFCINVFLILLCAGIFSCQKAIVLGALLVLAYIFQCVEEKSAMEEYLRALARGRFFIDISATIRERKVKQALATSVGLFLLYKFIKNMRKMQIVSELMKPHGNIMPTCREDIMQRDTERCAYAKVYVDKPPSSCRQNDTATPEQVCNTVFKNLLVLSVSCDNTSEYCDALAIKSNLVVVPKHMIYEGETLKTNKLTFRRHAPDSAGGIFSCIIDDSTVFAIPDQDLAVVYVPSSGSFADIARLLPRCAYSGSCMFVYKNKDGTRRQEGATVEPSLVKHSLAEFQGYRTALTNNTHRGLCMGTFVATCKSPHIVGFHLGGTPYASAIGVAGVLSYNDFVLAESQLGSLNFVTHSAGDFPREILGKQIITSDEIHNKSPVNYVEDATNVQIYGSCGGGVTFISRVIPSLISNSIFKHFGVENKWGKPPSLPSWRPWWETYNKFVHGSTGFSPKDVLWAINDYISPIRELLKDDFRRNMIRPLQSHEVINGVPGERFIDRMNFSSSIGYPLTGEKNKYLVDVEINGYFEPKTFTPEIWSEIYRCEEAWLKGERAYCPIKAVLKDEPTENTKEKMRVFYSMNIAVQYHLRRLTLGLARFIAMHPIVTESMVGMNCMSKEWDQWVKYSKSDGFDSCFAGDYKSYDTKMPAQLILASFSIYREVMQLSGNFSDKDFLIYDGIVSEIVYPFVAYNGTMISLTTAHISGNNLTVYINNTCNSLLKRIGFYNVEVKRTGTNYTFRDCERCANYGDDCKSNVNSSRVKYWNMITYRDFLAEHGMEFTMPDKSSEMVPFMNWEEAEFLKRKDAYVPEIDCIVGKLAEDSIFKSLHCVLKSDVLSPTDHAIATMDGAAYEFFPYGRQYYETAMEKLKLVALEHNIRPTGIFKTFDMRVEEWKMTHDPTSLEITDDGSRQALGSL